MTDTDRWKQPLQSYKLVLVVPHRGGQHFVRHRRGDGYEAIHESEGFMDNYPTSMPERSLNVLIQKAGVLRLVAPSETPFSEIGAQGVDA